MHYRIQDLNHDEKPREKLIAHGRRFLTDVELIALILGTGNKKTGVLEVARVLLKTFGSIENIGSASVNQLTAISAINTAKACALIAAIELGTRSSSSNIDNFPIVKKPEDAVNILNKEMVNATKEMLYLISLNSRNRVISKDLISIGTVNETLFSTREILKQALLRNAVGIIIAHNHPSKDPEPSKEDITATNTLQKACEYLNLPLIDHLIITNTSYYSLKSKGLIKVSITKGGEQNAENTND